jgi:hypothetical protein
MPLDHRRASASYRAAASHPTPLVPLVWLVVTSPCTSRQTNAHPPARPPSVTQWLTHPGLMDFYVGFRWFTGQIVHFFGRQMKRWQIIVLAVTELEGFLTDR